VIQENVGNHGGGTSASVVDRCLVTRNNAQRGAGIHGGTVRNSVITQNNASMDGAGVFFGTIENSVVCYNMAPAGGMHGASVRNSIVYYNSPTNYDGVSFTYSCTTPQIGGTGNISSDPQFENAGTGDYRLRLTSPCIDKGGYAEWMYSATDMAGNPRVLNGTVDIGAYETAFKASPKVFLQGAYDTNSHVMTMSLLKTNAVPLTSPYAADQRAVSAIPSNTTDWIMLDVRDTNGNAIASRSAFVNKDGYITSENGSTGLVVDVSPNEPCYLVVEHRNHLGVMSAAPIVFTDRVMSYDFTTASSCYYGGTNGCVELETGVWGMIAGDADGDGKITETDRAIIQQQAGKTGYLPGDLNLDGKVE